MKRLLWVLLFVWFANVSAPAVVTAQGPCVGTSGSATIGGTAWQADCVFAITATSCVDSAGANYECFQIVGSDSTQGAAYSVVQIFLDAPPVQGSTYTLGGASGRGALVIGNSGFFVTADTPHVGSVHVAVYNPGGGTIDCTFSFLAKSLFGPGDLTVTNGTFSGRLVPVGPASWSAMKQIYR
jgi:hypothetical protein